MALITNRQASFAVGAVRREAKLLRLTAISTGFAAYPAARLEFNLDGEAPDFAPLLTFCLDSVIYRGLVRVLAEAHSKLLREPLSVKGVYPRDAYSDDEMDELMNRLNRFLIIEVNLWALARDAGAPHGVPYPVRYWSAAYLWSPRIAGSAWCLRCGRLVTWQRRGRKEEAHSRTLPLCRECVRSGIGEWPKHAVMPETQGKWWLNCQHPGCRKAFVSAGQAHLCPDHKRRYRSPSKRRMPASLR